MTVTGVQNKRSRSDLLFSRLAAKKTVKRTMANIAHCGEKALNTTNPVALEECREKNNGGQRMARSNVATALSNALRYAKLCPLILGSQILLERRSLCCCKIPITPTMLCILPPIYNHAETLMPGWGTGSFENEDAQDFLNALDSKQPVDLKEILTRVVDRSPVDLAEVDRAEVDRAEVNRAGDDADYLAAPEASIAIAAAEVVAIAIGKPPRTIPRQTEDQIQDWIGKIEGAPSPEMLELARRAVSEVRLNSELKDLWLEADGLNDWSASLRDLEERLTR
jgi:Domain of unknown function (DUF4259)